MPIGAINIFPPQLGGVVCTLGATAGLAEGEGLPAVALAKAGGFALSPSPLRGEGWGEGCVPRWPYGRIFHRSDGGGINAPMSDLTAFLDNIVNDNFSIARQMAISAGVSVQFDTSGRSDGFSYRRFFADVKRGTKREAPYYVIAFNIDVPATVQTATELQSWVFELLPMFNRFAEIFRKHAVDKEAIIQTKLSSAFCNRFPEIFNEIIKAMDAFIEDAYDGRYDKERFGSFLNKAFDVSNLIILSDADTSITISHELRSFLRETCYSISCIINSSITSVSSAVQNVVLSLKHGRKARIKFSRGEDHKGNFKDAATRVQFEKELRRLILSAIMRFGTAEERQTIEIALEDAAGETVVKVDNEQMTIDHNNFNGKR